MRFALFWWIIAVPVLAQQPAVDTTQKALPVPVRDTVVTKTTPTAAVAEEVAEPYDSTAYRLKTGDRLRIRNLNALEIIYPQSAGTSVGGTSLVSQTAATAPPYEISIDARGQITLPQIGRVKVAGLSRQEATREIERRYSDYITNPIFEVDIINLRFKVLGAVIKQGVFTLENEKMSLGEVIAMAGGVDFAIADKTIKLIRAKSSTQEEISLDVRNLNDPKVANVPVYDGDYIFIPPSKGTLRSVKNQRISAVLQPIALTLNAVAIIFGIYFTYRQNRSQ
jgi:polysaccharide biosynthesis/export protein